MCIKCECRTNKTLRKKNNNKHPETSVTYHHSLTQSLVPERSDFAFYYIRGTAQKSRTLMSMIKNGTLMSAQNQKSATVIQSRPPMSKIKNGHLCLKIEKRWLMSKKDKPLASKSINRPQLSKSRYRLLESLIKYRPLISKIKDRSQVFKSIKRVQSKR